MIIFNAGVPRSGTVLVNAMIRALLAQRSIPVVQANPHGQQLPDLIRQILRLGEYRHRPFLVHTHSWSEETERVLGDKDQTIAIANYRDPRDVCVSLMRLHDLTFDEGQQAVQAFFREFEGMVAALDALVIPYELLIAAPGAHCFQIARHLGLWPTFDQIDAVVEETSIDRHRKTMQDVQAGQVAQMTERQNRRRVLREDRKTLINDRHIQSGVSGRWRDELDVEQQAQANEAFKPILERYGYATGQP